MADKVITIETLDKLKPIVYDIVKTAQQRFPDCRLCTIRMEASESNVGVAYKGNPVGANSDWEISLGAQTIAGHNINAPGYYGLHLGPKDLNNFRKIATEAVHESYRRALACSKLKQGLKEDYGELGKSVYSTNLAHAEPLEDTHVLYFKKDPRAIPLKEVVDMVTRISKSVGQIKNISLDEQVVYSVIIRKLFASSEGILTDQVFPLSQFLSVAQVNPPDGSRSVYYDCLGDLAGWEVFEGENIYNQTAEEFAMDLARRASRLCNAPQAPNIDTEVPVVWDGHYGALLVHEIWGHPCEADRILKMETGYAGRSRLFKNFEDHQIGQQVASPLVNVFSDPAMLGYGHYKYDDEGILAKRVVHVRNGILTADFLNSRETAHIMSLCGIPVKANGGVRAMDPVVVPLIRMNNTCFAPGKSNPEDIIKEVDDGYYFKFARVPSISESRENFRISAEETWKIENGKLTTLYRDGSISADSQNFMMKVDAVGNDFKNYPVSNCGKGQPMQAMRVGNGSPTMRSYGKVAGGHMKK